MIPIPANLCFLCGAEAGQSETEGNWLRVVCHGSCGRYVISWGVVRQVLSNAAQTATLKQTYAARAASTATTGRILILQLKHGQITEDTIPPEDDLWATVPWINPGPPKTT